MYFFIIKLISFYCSMVKWPCAERWIGDPAIVSEMTFSLACMLRKTFLTPCERRPTADAICRIVSFLIRLPQPDPEPESKRQMGDGEGKDSIHDGAGKLLEQYSSRLS